FSLQAEHGRRARTVTGVQTCALPILAMGAAKQAAAKPVRRASPCLNGPSQKNQASTAISPAAANESTKSLALRFAASASTGSTEIGRASCRGRVWGALRTLTAGEEEG